MPLSCGQGRQALAPFSYMFLRLALPSCLPSIVKVVRVSQPRIFSFSHAHDPHSKWVAKRQAHGMITSCIGWRSA